MVTVKYVSTRGEAPSLNFCDALLAGLARDGGLYVPKEWPRFSKKEIRALRGKSYQEIAFTVLSPFVDGEIADDKFRAISLYLKSEVIPKTVAQILKGPKQPA